MPGETKTNDVQKDVSIRIDVLRQKMVLRPGDCTLYNELGVALAAGGRVDEALRAFERAVELCPGFAEAWFNLGLVHEILQQFLQAFEAVERASQLAPGYEAARNKGAEIGRRIGRRQKSDPWQPISRRSIWKSLLGGPDVKKGKPSAVLQWNADGASTDGDFREAIAANPGDAEPIIQFGRWLLRKERFIDAELFLRYALALKPHDPAASLALADILERTRRIPEAIETLEAADSVAKATPLVELLRLRLLVAAWDGLDELTSRVLAALRCDPDCCSPYFSLLLPTTLDDQRACATAFTGKIKENVVPLPKRIISPAQRIINIGYISADFHQHVTATLMVELPELHDRKKFRITGYGLWLDDKSSYSKRLRAGCDRFVELYDVPTHAAASKIREDEIDILVDLNGYTSNARPKILAFRPAPIQAQFLAYPGTLGADFIDYLIADSIIVPKEHAGSYTEQLVYLPHTYQPNDRKRACPPKPGSRRDHGLPERGSVFCNFNNLTRITPGMFDVWARVLLRVPESVLWLVDSGATARENLRAAAAARGVAAERLIFAPSAAHAEHMARYWHADLFLDTLPYNAHTTCSEALWIGCPVLTCIGDTFAGRVAASLLIAAGVPELITATLTEYENQAVRLATRKAELNRIRNKLRDERKRSPLFDSQGTTRALEWAYARMFERLIDGRAPESFVVPSSI